MFERYQCLRKYATMGGCTRRAAHLDRHTHAVPESSDHLVPLYEFPAARERLVGRVARTPLLTSSTAARWIEAATETRLGDSTLYLKAEHLQKTGSFKARGMTNRLANGTTLSLAKTGVEGYTNLEVYLNELAKSKH